MSNKNSSFLFNLLYATISLSFHKKKQRPYSSVLYLFQIMQCNAWLVSQLTVRRDWAFTLDQFKGFLLHGQLTPSSSSTSFITFLLSSIKSIQFPCFLYFNISFSFFLYQIYIHRKRNQIIFFFVADAHREAVTCQKSNL